MRKDRRSFFEKLTGAINMDEDDYEYEDDFAEVDEGYRPREQSFREPLEREPAPRAGSGRIYGAEDRDQPLGDSFGSEGQLSVDVMQTPDDIIVKTIVAGIRPEDLDVSISRDSITIRGSREEDVSVSEGDFFHRELFWGSFSRTISLPEEVDVEGAEAFERHGLLTISLPKVDKGRETKIQIKSH